MKNFKHASNTFCYLAGLIAMVVASSGHASPHKQKPDNYKGYIHLDIGYSQPAKEMHKANYANKPNGAFSATIGTGHVLTHQFRTDLTASYRGIYHYSHTRKSGGKERQSFSNISLMLNTYISPKTFQHHTPYLMAGLGLSINKAGDASLGQAKLVGKCKENLAWQLGIGTMVNITKHINADLAYKYIDLGKTRTSNIRQNTACSTCGGNSPSLKGKLTTHEFSIGLNYFF